MTTKFGFHVDKGLKAEARTYSDFATLDITEENNEVVFFVKTVEDAIAIQHAACDLVKAMVELKMGLKVNELVDSTVKADLPYDPEIKKLLEGLF